MLIGQLGNCPSSRDENEVGRYHVEEILTESNTEWTAPKDAVKGETVFFMHSKTSIDTIRRLKRQLQSEGFDSRPDAYDTIADALDHGEELYRRIGGCVFAKGVVSGDVIVDENARNSGLHWSSIYPPAMPKHGYRHHLS